MSNSKLEDWKKRWLDAAEVSIEESLAFASSQIPPQKDDESDDTYINRQKRLSEAKKKFLDNAKGLMNTIEEDNTRKQDADKPDNRKEKTAGEEKGEEGDSGIPTPESRAN